VTGGFDGSIEMERFLFNVGKRKGGDLQPKRSKKKSKVLTPEGKFIEFHMHDDT
jgi:hypothetical protein